VTSNERDLAEQRRTDVERHEPTDGAPAVRETPHEKPEDWGWHAEMGVLARGAGWISAAILLVMIIGNDIGHIAQIWLIALAALLVLMLLRDRHQRKNSWRG
jgi:hypothetical protein